MFYALQSTPFYICMSLLPKTLERLTHLKVYLNKALTLPKTIKICQMKLHSKSLSKKNLNGLYI